MKNPALDRIRKLLRLANDRGASPAEAAAALTKAIELARKEGINLCDVSSEDAAGYGGIGHQEAPARAGVIDQAAAAIAAIHFHCQSLTQRKNGTVRFIFVGLPDAVQCAIYTYTYIRRALASAWKAATDRRLRLDGFVRGFCQAMFELMPQAFPQSHGLIIVCDRYIHDVILPPGATIKEGKSIASKSSHAHASRRAGYRAGKKVGIRAPLPAPSPKPQKNLRSPINRSVQMTLF